MWIDLKTIYAGPGGNLSPGKVEVDEKTGNALVSGGYATLLDNPEKKVASDPEKIETAITKPPEKAVSRRGRKRNK